MTSKELQALSRKIGQAQTAANRAHARGDLKRAEELAKEAQDLRAQRSALLRGAGH